MLCVVCCLLSTNHIMVTGGCSLSQFSLAERWGPPWTGLQSISGPTQRDPKRQTTTHTYRYQLLYMHIHTERPQPARDSNWGLTVR
ncbi:hypothetical protein Q5P01_000554 [Channa striata]|uniref:Secreted protein n=1 Tax=Channa striata TaxID=64152 RepID=A0AA88IZL4_CHASR|nr:hypothetical protein Q5P01_000554 [Channa striata]